MAHKYVMFTRSETVSENGKFVEREYTDGPIRVMAEADGYAMVRRKGRMPFVIKSKDILKD